MQSKTEIFFHVDKYAFCGERKEKGYFQDKKEKILFRSLKDIFSFLS